MTPAWVVKQIETWRREHKWSAQRISDELADSGFRIDRRTVTRHLTRLGLGRRRFIDPGGDNNRNPGKIVARWPGHMVHLDVKKVGRIPDGGGWRIHGRDSDQTKTVSRAKAAGAKRGYTYLHSAVDGFSRLAYTEPLSDEKGATAAAFLARAKVWFAAHGITHIHRVVTDNGACYRSGDFAWIVGKSTRHQKTKPYTPQHNGKVERYQRILAEELLYARNFNSEEDRSSAISVWNIHYNYCESLSGWSGTGWQGERRAAPALRPWLLQLFAPKGAFRWTCPALVRGGRRSPGPLRWLDQKTVRPRLFGEVVTHHSIAPK